MGLDTYYRASIRIMNNDWNNLLQTSGQLILHDVSLQNSQRSISQQDPWTRQQSPQRQLSITFEHCCNFLHPIITTWSLTEKCVGNNAQRLTISYPCPDIDCLWHKLELQFEFILSFLLLNYQSILTNTSSAGLQQLHTSISPIFCPFYYPYTHLSVNDNFVITVHNCLIYCT